MITLPLSVRRLPVKTLVLAAAYVGTILAANAALQHVGPLTLGPLAIPSGVWFAGMAFILRDLIQQEANRPRRWVLGSIGVGTAASLAVSAGDGWRIALGAGAAFLVSELLDYRIFSRLRHRGFLTASTTSNVAAALVDTLLFLPIAFGSLAYAPGQVVGKLGVAGVFAAAYAAGRAIYRRRA